MEFGSLGPDWRDLSVAVGLVLLGGSAPAAFAACCCTQLKTEQ